jgi:hypothetical protein
MMNSFLIFFCFPCYPLATSHVAFFLLRGLLGPLLACTSTDFTLNTHVFLTSE